MIFRGFMSFEYTVYQKIGDGKGKIVGQVEVEQIEYDVNADGVLEIKSWSLWSETLNEFRAQDLEQIRKDWPTLWKNMETRLIEHYRADFEIVNLNKNMGKVI